MEDNRADRYCASGSTRNTRPTTRRRLHLLVGTAYAFFLGYSPILIFDTIMTYSWSADLVACTVLKPF